MTNGVHIDKKRDILYVVATNHSNEGPDVTAIDLKKIPETYVRKGVRYAEINLCLHRARLNTRVW